MSLAHRARSADALGMCIRLAVRTSPALVMVVRSNYSVRISPVQSRTLQRSLGCRSEKWRPYMQRWPPPSMDRPSFRKRDRTLEPVALSGWGQVHSYDYTSIVKPCFSATDLINRENLP
jgi:hypothetical protein